MADVNKNVYFELSDLNFFEYFETPGYEILASWVIK